MEAATISTNTEISKPDKSPSLDFIWLMDNSLYRAAVQGNIDAFKQHGEHPLDQLVTPNKNTILHIYITARSKDHQASLDFVKAILDMCPNLLWQVNNKDETLLHIAARHGHDDIVNLLIEKSKETHFNDQENGLGGAMQLLKRMTKAKDTALHEAVRFKHIDVVKILIKENVRELHEINSGGETPFYLAVERGYKVIVTEMKDSAKEFKAYDGPNGRTALHAAVLREDLELTKLVLELEISLTKKADEKGWNPFHYAADKCYSEIVTEILNYDKSVAYCVITDENKMSAVHLIVRRTACSAHATERLETLRKLISSCPSCAEMVDNRNWNFLHFAVDTGNYKVFDLIIENPSLFNLVNEGNSNGNTPLLHFFASESSEHQRKKFCQTFKKFYEQNHPKVDVNAFNLQNRNVLDMIMSQGSLDENRGLIAEDQWDWMPKAFTKSENIKSGLRIVNENSEDGQSTSNDKKHRATGLDKYISKIQLEKEGYLVAAALIATVSFTAGLTVPGGYKNDVGTALLIKFTAFQLFSVTNTLAFICSSCAVLSHILLVTGGESSDKYTIFSNFVDELSLTVSAMVFMVLAFITGSYAVLDSSRKLAISLCVIQCLFMGPFFFSKRGFIRIIIHSMIAVPLNKIVSSATKLKERCAR